MSSIRSGFPLSLDDLHRVVPAAFADAPDGRVSSKYQFIPTSIIITSLMNHGLVPMMAAQTGTRRTATADGIYSSHLIRFRRPQDVATVQNVGDTIPEVCLSNSHDRSASYRVTAGLFRLVCTNGMTVGNNAWSFATRHTGEQVVQEVIRDTFKIIEDFPRLMTTIEHWKDIQLERGQQLAFADVARALRFTESSKVQAEDLLQVRRGDDEGSSLWITFNRLQENLLRRGVPVRGTHRVTAGIGSLATDTRINKGLWSLAERVAEMVTV